MRTKHKNNFRGIYNARYMGGPYEAFIYLDTWKGYKHRPDFDLFNGWTSGKTVSRATLEMLVAEEAIRNDEMEFMKQYADCVEGEE